MSNRRRVMSYPCNCASAQLITRKEMRYYASVNEPSTCPSPLRGETEENQGLATQELSRYVISSDSQFLRRWKEEEALRELTLATVLHSRVTREETELEEEAERRERRERPPSSDGGARSAIRAGG